MATQAVERLYRLTVDAGAAVRELQKLNKSTANIEKGFGRLGDAARLATRAIAVLGAGVAVKNLVDTANQVQLLEASFGALTGSAERGSNLIKRSFALVAETGAGFDDVSTSLQRLTIGMTDLGATNAQIEGVAEAFVKIGRIGGTSMFSINQALVQFTQGLASGRLQGDELRSILERVPLITSLIAKEMGVTRGEIKEMGKEGKVTADIMVNALLKALPKIREDFASLPVIVEQSLNRIQATWIELITALAVDTDFANSIVSGLEAINKWLKSSTPNILQFVEDMSQAVKAGEAFGYALVGSITAIGAAIMVTNPFATFAAAAVAAAVYVITNWDKVSLWFTHKMPTFIDQAAGYLTKFYQGMLTGAAFVLKQIENIAQAAISSIASELDPILEFLEIDFKFGDIDLSFGDEAVDAAKKVGEQAEEYFQRAEQGSKEYEAALADLNAELAATAKAAKEAAAEVGTVDTPVNVSKITKDLEKLREQLDPMQKIMNNFSEGWSVLVAASDAELFKDNPEELQKLAKMLVEIRDKAIAANDPMKEYKKSIEELLDKVVEGREPMREFEEAVALLNLAVAKGDIDPTMYDEYYYALERIRDEALKVEDSMADMIQSLKDSVDGFARDFTNTLVDSLAEGKLAFDQFAKDVLKTIAKIMTNRIFEEFFGMIASGIFGSIGWGGSTGTGSTGGGWGGWGRPRQLALVGGGTTPAIGTMSTSASAVGGGIGVLMPAIRRMSAGNQGQVVNVNVTNNAPVDVEVQEKRANDGSLSIDMLIERKVNQQMASGSYDRTLRSNFGLGRRAY